MIIPLDSRTAGGWVVPEVKIAFLSFDLGDVASGGHKERNDIRGGYRGGGRGLEDPNDRWEERGELRERSGTCNAVDRP